MNPYAILGILLGFAALGCWATYEDGRASKWEGKYDSLQASFKVAAQQAKDDAAKQEASDLAKLQSQSSQAIQQATYAKNQAQLAAATYSQKLAQLAGKPKLDIGHQCALTPVPSDLLP